jgi:hypothetical protein
MDNPKTTLIGCAMILLCLGYAAMKILMGTLTTDDIMVLAGILAGGGFIATRDGGR